VSLKNKPLSKSELAAYEATRDLAAELLQSVREMKAGHVQVVSSPVIEARKKTGLSQSQFAALLGVSVRTLQGWEQGRKQPSGAGPHSARNCQHKSEGAVGCCRQVAPNGKTAHRFGQR
jgi:putative transcriptional regulator